MTESDYVNVLRSCDFARVKKWKRKVDIPDERGAQICIIAKKIVTQGMTNKL